jgi:hypothetical protein
MMLRYGEMFRLRLNSKLGEDAFSPSVRKIRRSLESSVQTVLDRLAYSHRDFSAQKLPLSYREITIGGLR